MWKEVYSNCSRLTISMSQIKWLQWQIAKSIYLFFASMRRCTCTKVTVRARSFHVMCHLLNVGHEKLISKRTQYLFSYIGNDSSLQMSGFCCYKYWWLLNHPFLIITWPSYCNDFSFRVVIFRACNLRILQDPSRYLSWFYMLLLLCRRISSLLFLQDLIKIFTFLLSMNYFWTSGLPPHWHSLVCSSSMHYRSNHFILGYLFIYLFIYL